MPPQILATKLFAPQIRPAIVPRSRLLASLNKGLAGKLTLVSAPAGFGKTTLVGEWIANLDQPAAWLSLDESDNDLNRFLAYFIAALQSILPDLGSGVLKALQAPPPVPTEPLLVALLNDITAIPNDFLLVLDDYHVIDAPEVHETLIFFLNHLPQQMHLVITTREDPPLPLPRLRVRGKLNELGTAELRFNSKEAADFLNQVMDLNLSSAAVQSLEERTEGWIAGLQLAALSMRGHQGSERFIESFTGSHRLVVDYLAEEILQQQSQEVQTFLLQTSVLARLCGPLCDAVVGEKNINGQGILTHLVRSNLLIAPLDGQGQWYRYHQLFADALHGRLLKEQPDLAHGLHRRACAWFENNNLHSEAIGHALAGGDFGHAADLIENEWSIIRRSCFRSPTWLSWVEALPQEIVRQRPVIIVGYAWELLNFGQLQAAEQQMILAEQWLEPGDDDLSPDEANDQEMVIANQKEWPYLRATLASARAFYAQALGDVPGTMKYARRTLANAQNDDQHTRGIASFLLGLGFWSSGELEKAYQAMSEGMVDLRQAGSFLFAISGTIFMADILVDLGRLRLAISTLQEALRLAEAQGKPYIEGVADLFLGLCDLFREQGNLQEAEAFRERSVAVKDGSALPYWDYRYLLAQAREKEARGDLDGALQLLIEAEGTGYDIPVPPIRPLAALKAEIWIRQGALSKAQAWADQRGLAVNAPLDYLQEFEHHILARLLIGRYRSQAQKETLAAAEDLLRRLLDDARKGKRVGSVIAVQITQALARQAANDISAAQNHLQQALLLAEPEGYVRIFVKEGLIMRELLGLLAIEDERLSAYVQRLLAYFGEEKSEHDLIEPLTPREQEVLRLIAAGRSNPEIAAELVIAVTTVKTHVKNIYGKLGVSNRFEAIERSRGLNLTKSD